MSGQGQYKTHHTVHRNLMDLFMDLPKGNKEHDKGVHCIGRTTFAGVGRPTFLQAGLWGHGGHLSPLSQAISGLLGSCRAVPCLPQPPESALRPLLGHWGRTHINPVSVGHPMLASLGLPGGNGGVATQPPVPTLCFLGPGL